METRDNSDYAILERYRKANELAIITSNRITFDSIRDVHWLVQQNKGLKEQVEQLKSEVLTLKSSSK